MTTADMIHQLKLELWNLSYNQWKTQDLFSIQWWLYNWNYFYSFILIIGLALLSRWVVLGVLSIEKNTNNVKGK